MYIYTAYTVIPRLNRLRSNGFRLITAMISSTFWTEARLGVCSLDYYAQYNLLFYWNLLIHAYNRGVVLWKCSYHNMKMIILLGYMETYIYNIGTDVGYTAVPRYWSPIGNTVVYSQRVGVIHWQRCCISRLSPTNLQASVYFLVIYVIFFLFSRKMG